MPAQTLTDSRTMKWILKALGGYAQVFRQFHRLSLPCESLPQLQTCGVYESETRTPDYCTEPVILKPIHWCGCNLLNSPRWVLRPLVLSPEAAALSTQERPCLTASRIPASRLHGSHVDPRGPSCESAACQPSSSSLRSVAGTQPISQKEIQRYTT